VTDETLDPAVEQPTEAPAEETGPPVDLDAVRKVVEALLFASDKPLSPGKLAEAVGDASASQVRKAVESLQQEYDETGRAFQIEGISGGYQLLSRPEYMDAILKLRKSKSDGKLSAAAMETLAIIAYKQPIKRVDIEAIRGVKSDSLVRALMEKGLVKIVGKDNVPGNPMLYGTTKDFLDLLGIQGTKDLPTPEKLQ
jgi:segregation and condensation protein B